MKPLHALAALLALPLALGEGEVEISTDGGPFATFHHGEEDRVPFLWPVLGPGGVEVTRAFPMEQGREGESPDHPHHTSLWFAHGDVSGHDFWHDRDGARVVPAGDVEVSEEDGAVRVTSAHRWVTGERVPLLEEARTMTFRDLDGGRAIDLDLRLTALRDVTFGDTKEGTFALRLHPALRPKGEVARGTAMNSEGDDAIWGKRARWVDYWGPVPHGEEERVLGVAVLDHPENLRHPTWWHARDYGLVGANPFGVHDFERKPAGTGDHALAEGETLRLRYRVWIHEGPGDAAVIERGWRRWAGVKATREEPAAAEGEGGEG